MPSPFPGMDPFLESPEIWVDFHNNLASEIQATLNRLLPPHYVARLTPRFVYEMVEIAEARVVRPDVGVYRTQPAAEAAPVATATVTAPVESVVPLEEGVRFHSVEILEVPTLRLVTAIEILSPVNKRVGHRAREDYLRKRRSILWSDAHLMEIDLLRGGQRMPLEKPVPKAAYYVVLSRSYRRPIVEVWPIQLWERLPVVPVPLRLPDPDVPLDLSAVVATVYDRGAYERLIDYRQSPPPPLTAEEEAWIEQVLREKGLR